MFGKILIANRGEIAVRVIRACKEMGIASVAVFSEADKEALHVSLADESYCIGKPLPRDSYLNQQAVLSCALAARCEAIHPGYGFLSENADFADLCEKNGVVFIGPPASVIRRMGDKDEARRTMLGAGVPVIPGSGVVGSFGECREESGRIGFPLLIKARSGGGGRGIRRVDDLSSLEKNYSQARAESRSAFGDDAVYLERYISRARHVEVQVLCDNHGGAACLGDRDCSMQRRHQKVIEEAPAPRLSKELRERMRESSLAAARAVSYRGAGTVEYLVEPDGSYWFMEMNTRLQVEHPVTEMVSGLDLVKWQIRAAAGMKLDFSDEDTRPMGHAIECRVNAESSWNFLPSTGTIGMLHVPGGPWVRFDTAVYQGYTVSPYYDSLLGKLIVHAKTRDEAIRKMRAALCELILEGVDHNADFLLELLSSPAFAAGEYDTRSIDEFLAEEVRP